MSQTLCFFHVTKTTGRKPVDSGFPEEEENPGIIPWETPS